MKSLLVLALIVGVQTIPAVTERSLFEALGARDLPPRGWLTVADARARYAEEAARCKLARAAGRADARAENRLAVLRELIERRAAATGHGPVPATPDVKSPRPLFGSVNVRVFVCRYRGGLEPRYHRAGCPRLRGVISEVDLALARRTCTPCPVCTVYHK